MAWAEDYRQKWIAESIRVFGFINHRHLQRKFGISAPQAAKDFARFQRDHAGIMLYDASAKCYYDARFISAAQAKGGGK